MDCTTTDVGNSVPSVDTVRAIMSCGSHLALTHLFLQSFVLFHYMWIAPLQMLGTVYLLWTLLGPSYLVRLTLLLPVLAELCDVPLHVDCTTADVGISLPSVDSVRAIMSCGSHLAVTHLFLQSFVMFHYMWIAPLQMSGTVYLLWTLLGPLCLVGVTLLLLTCSCRALCCSITCGLHHFRC